MSMLNMLAAETGAAIIATHHVRKEDTPKSAQQVRNSIRGSSAIVDQSRFAIVLWQPDDAEVKKTCKTMGADYQPNAVVYGAVVKSNDGASRDRWITLRDANGVLRDITADLILKRARPEELLAATVDAIASAAKAGRPYTKTGVNGPYERRSEMGEAFADISKHRMAALVDELLNDGKIVQALAGGTTVKWLDVPDGPFAKGEGEFAPGASTAQGGPKR